MIALESYPGMLFKVVERGIHVPVFISVKKKRFGSRIRYYDIKSLYPDVMRNGEYPVGFPEVKRRDFDYSENAHTKN